MSADDITPPESDGVILAPAKNNDSKPGKKPVDKPAGTPVTTPALPKPKAPMPAQSRMFSEANSETRTALIKL